ncbi:secretory lipase-domain-containing protein [Aspergillus coremiiformis]|uniref:Secretory lipase-domain-containing protein n=1 Tax=Aspergillus coremiiformis TaxID=138285 RepID=A0A5N6ZE40_9EURO|nr:secretory lipase-domain-containing protein [Aspergillus coremiiformis]
MAFAISRCCIFLYLAIIGQSIAGCVLSPNLVARDGPLLPSQDPFYKPDNEDWKTENPGTILKTRNVKTGATMDLPSDLQGVYQLLYRTTNARDQPSYAVTTVLVPSNATLDRLLSYQVAYDSPNINCSPSYTLQVGSSPSGDATNVELSAFAQYFLSTGIPISIPDYEGVEAAYTVGPQSAYGVLDSLRAVLSSTDMTGITSTAKTTLFGYSGGALAAEWAGELQSSYAPDLTIAGAAIGGVPVNITNALFTLDGTEHAGLIAGALVGVANAFPSFAQHVEHHLKPEFQQLFCLPKTTCAADVFNSSYGYVAQLANKHISTFFDNGWSPVTEYGRLMNSVCAMGQRGVPRFPVFMFQGTADTTVGPLGDVGQLARKLCRDGAVIQFAQVKGADHIPALLKGFSKAKSFLMDIYNGVAPNECTDTDIS